MKDQKKKYSYEEVLQMIAELSISQKETDEQLKENAIAQKKTDEQLKENAIAQKKTDEQMKKTDEKLEKLGISFGNFTNNQGEIAEEFFYSSLEKRKQLGNISYDDIGQNWKKSRNGIEDEFDIIMTNGKSIAVIEVKTKAHLNDVDQLEKKVENFKKLFPIYKDFEVQGGLATLKLNESVKNKLLEKGFYAIKQQGDHIEISSPL